MDYLDRIPDYTDKDFDEATLQCTCLEHEGDDTDCPVHNPKPQTQEEGVPA